MGEFFKSWRQKAGCVTLVMACVLMAAWVRGLCVTDRITYDIPAWNCSWSVHNGGGECTVINDWVDKGRLPRLPGLVWMTSHASDKRPHVVRTISVSRSWWFLGNQRIEQRFVTLRIASATILMCVVTIWLLLSKQRPVNCRVEPPKELP